MTTKTTDETTREELLDNIEESLDMEILYRDIADQHAADANNWYKRLHELDKDIDQNKDVSIETKSQVKPSNTY